MKIIIIGCGKVGITLAQELSDEGHDLVLIDHNMTRLQQVPEELDSLCLPGNGASLKVQMEAGIEEADILIAVTGSDELNLLCCLIAKKVGRCHTIARVRNPVYSDEIGFIKKSMGISMVINPERTASREIARLLQFPSAIQIDPFAKGRAQLLKFKVKQEFFVVGMSICKIRENFGGRLLVTSVERGDEVFIPNGDFVIEAGDAMSILATPVEATRFFKNIGLKTHQVKDCMIIGGGKVAYYLAQELLRLKIRVRIVEKNMDRCEELSELLPNAIILNGDGTDKNLLMEEGLRKCESFVALTDVDEENILLSLYAKDQSDAKLITKVNRIAFDEIIEDLELGSVIYPKFLTADYILRYVRGMSNSAETSNVETLYKILDNRAEALEFAVREKSEATGQFLMDLNLKDNTLIGCIHRNGKIIIPGGNDSIEVGDSVVVITKHRGFTKLNDILER